MEMNLLVEHGKTEMFSWNRYPQIIMLHSRKRSLTPPLQDSCSNEAVQQRIARQTNSKPPLRMQPLGRKDPFYF
jgi:hypothetical protein